MSVGWIMEGSKEIFRLATHRYSSNATYTTHHAEHGLVEFVPLTCMYCRCGRCPGFDAGKGMDLQGESRRLEPAVLWVLCCALD